LTSGGGFLLDPHSSFPTGTKKLGTLTADWPATPGSWRGYWDDRYVATLAVAFDAQAHVEAPAVFVPPR
jgi:hypothetical protein